jgi:hypothetical protein
MFERSIHRIMRPTERIRYDNMVFASKLFECQAQCIELHNVNRVGKERNWILFGIEDRDSSRRSLPRGHRAYLLHN